MHHTTRHIRTSIPIKLPKLIKHDMEKQISKRKLKSKTGKLRYQINMNTLAGDMIENMPDLLTDDP